MQIRSNYRDYCYQVSLISLSRGASTYRAVVSATSCNEAERLVYDQFNAEEHFYKGCEKMTDNPLHLLSITPGKVVGCPLPDRSKVFVLGYGRDCDGADNIRIVRYLDEAYALECANDANESGDGETYGVADEETVVDYCLENNKRFPDYGFDRNIEIVQLPRSNYVVYRLGEGGEFGL